MRHGIAWALLWVATTACSGNAATAGGQGGNDSGGVANPASGGVSGQSGATSSGGASASSGSGGRTSTGGGAHAGGTGATSPLDSGAGGEPRDASDATTPGNGGDGGADGGVCAGWDSILTRIDKACETDSNCALVSHEIGCCGEQELVGVNAEEAPAFRALEAKCAPSPDCPCVPLATDAEDGLGARIGSENLIAVKCDQGTCRSYYTGSTFTCGPRKCTDQQYCDTLVANVSGAGTSYGCEYLSAGCTSCSCVSSTGTCHCSQSTGEVVRTCSEQ